MSVSQSQSLLEQAEALQDMLIRVASGGTYSDDSYRTARGNLMRDASVVGLVPFVVRNNRDIAQVAFRLRNDFSFDGGRLEFIWDEFRPLLEALENRQRQPHEQTVSESLEIVSCETVNRAWAKALERRTEDPEGAITASRTLLEAVCKRILDDIGIVHTGKEDFSELYKMVAKELRLAPDNYPEKNFKAILSSCQGIVNHLATLRNGLSDAHAPNRPTRPLSRHATLAVNLAGTMASFLVETWLARKGINPSA